MTRCVPYVPVICSSDAVKMSEELVEPLCSRLIVVALFQKASRKAKQKAAELNSCSVGAEIASSISTAVNFDGSLDTFPLRVLVAAIPGSFTYTILTQVLVGDQCLQCFFTVFRLAPVNSTIWLTEGKARGYKRYFSNRLLFLCCRPSEMESVEWLARSSLRVSNCDMPQNEHSSCVCSVRPSTSVSTSDINEEQCAQRMVLSPDLG